jgi:GTP cyclohydrolase III
MNQIYLVQQYPYEDWETVANFNNEQDAIALCEKLKFEHSQLKQQYNNFKVKAIFDNEINRNYFNVK